MAKKIGIDVDLRDEKAKKKLKELQNGKYKVDLDVDVNDAKQATQSMNQLSSATKSTSNAFDKLRNAAKDMFSAERISLTAYVAIMREINKAAENMVQSVKNGSVFGKDGDTSFTLNVVGVHNTFLYFLVVTEDTALL